jgi:hypothetical protein
MIKRNYMSYTIHNSTTWSDGSRTGVPHFTPNLAKCPNCDAVFFLHNLWAKKEDADFEETRYYKDIADPNFSDYAKAVQKGLAKNADEEIEVRTLLWRALNSRVGSNDEHIELWQDNCEKLLPLKEQKLNEIMETENIKEINNLRIEIAELKRNLGRFDECLKDLESLPDSFDWLKEQFAEKCGEQDTKVFELRVK